MNDINQNIARNLLKLRKNAKLTQVELAEKFNYSDKSVSKWEKGESMPSVEVLKELANFYGTTLDALTKDEDVLEQKSIEPVSLSKDKMFPMRPIITLLAVSAVWLCATIAFAIVKIVAEINFWYVFLWAVPLSCVVLIVFTSIWSTKKRYLFIEMTILLWSLIVCIHIQFLKFNLWPLYIVGIPLQIAIILWGALVKKKPNKKRKDITESKNQQNNNNTPLSN